MALLALAAIAGCQSDDGSANQSSSDTTEDTGGNAAEARPQMPDLICVDLQDAQDLMQEVVGTFFAVDSYDASGDGRSQIIDSNWVVVEQQPKAGESIGDDPRIGAVKDDEADQCNSSAPAETRASAVAPSTSDAASAPDPTSAPAPAAAAAEPISSGLTPSEQNAARAAQSYLDFAGFSRQGLIDQLSSEYGDQFPVADATVAVDSLIVDWNEEAKESAQNYLSFAGFSRRGLIDQLSSEYGDQFTVEQATTAVDGITVDWNEEAAESAQNYLDISGFSCQGLIDQLASDYGDQFTNAQATYGATQAGIC